MEALTPRELEVLALYGNGHSGPQIAKKCFISKRTVEKTFEKARHRLTSKTNGQALLRAVADEQLILSHDGAVRVPELAS